MAIIKAKTTVAAGATSAFTSTDGYTTIMIGTDTTQFRVLFKLGSTLEYAETNIRKGAKHIVLAKAETVAVENTSATDSLEFEIWA